VLEGQGVEVVLLVKSDGNKKWWRWSSTVEQGGSRCGVKQGRAGMREAEGKLGETFLRPATRRDKAAPTWGGGDWRPPALASSLL
jgi:hypothetical protein